MLRVGFTRVRVSASRRELLPHDFTLASRRGGLFLWHFPSGYPDRPLACTLPREARTFLTFENARLPGDLRMWECSISVSENSPFPSRPRPITACEKPLPARRCLDRFFRARRCREFTPSSGADRAPRKRRRFREVHVASLRMGIGRSGVFGGIAQLVEHHAGSVRVRSSSLLASTRISRERARR